MLKHLVVPNLALICGSFLALFCVSVPIANAEERTFDLVILNGRAMDPESGFDQIAHVGISDGVTTAQGLQVRDGVTTALDQEGGAFPIERFYRKRHGRSRINFGICSVTDARYRLCSRNASIDRVARRLVARMATRGRQPQPR